MEDPLLEELSCSICLEIFNKPILLDCAHNICASHLHEICETKTREGIVLPCPICRARCVRQSMDGFKVNLALANVIDIMKKRTSTDDAGVGAALALITECITSLKVQILPHTGPKQEPGWYFHPQDLNEKNKGKFIYIGWKKGEKNIEPITSLNFMTFTSSQTSPPTDWEWDPSDLNTGARGDFIYMYWKREYGKPGITDITLSGPLYEPQPPPMEGWQLINVDLCKGCSRLTHISPYQYCYYKI